jgi:hypothetical protein
LGQPIVLPQAAASITAWSIGSDQMTAGGS